MQIIRNRKKHHMGRDLQIMYISTILIPILVVGAVLIGSSFFSQKIYYQGLLTEFNTRITQTVYDLTSYAYNMSQTIVENVDLQEALNADYARPEDFRDALNRVQVVDPAFERYAGIEKAMVFVDYDKAGNTGNITKVTEEIKQQEWYKTACSRYSSFWTSYKYKDAYNKNEVALALVRKMPMAESDRQAVVVIIISNSFLTSRVENGNFAVDMAVNQEPLFFSSDTEVAEVFDELSIDFERVNFKAEDTLKINGRRALFSIASLKPAQSSYTQIYIAAFDRGAYQRIGRNVWLIVLVLAVAAVLPMVLTAFNTKRFTDEVLLLRNEMHKASHGKKMSEQDYEQPEKLFRSIELCEAYEDLLIMVKNIEEMEEKEYAAEIQRQKANTDQKKMEFKVLASQINPHFLYNTLEMIRMKALTNQDREVAKAIKLLGQSMRYVLEHTTTQETTLQKEFDHIMTYLQIQQLRFEDRVNYQVNIEPGLDMEAFQMLPLTLQPIVENAIIHGLEKREKDGKIWIAIYTYEKCLLCIDISDNGGGMTQETLDMVRHRIEYYQRERNTSSIALYNINRRIKLNYGSGYGVSVDSTFGEGTRVSIVLPIRHVGDAMLTDISKEKENTKNELTK